jgi:NADP-dependent 3-hydroxy acid dehydrogenase YdfG
MTSRSEHGLQHVLVVGAGSGLSASIARRFAAEGLAVSLAARNTEKLAGLADEVGAEVYTCDASQTDQVDVLFANLDKAKGRRTGRGGVQPLGAGARLHHRA